MRLQRFQAQDASQILGWIRNSSDLYNWCTTIDYPITDKSIFQRWFKDSDIHAFYLTEDKRTVGYGEVWYDDNDHSAELGRLLVDPQLRRQGYGVKLVRALLESIDKEKYTVVMRVVPTNLNAIDCYLKAGFIKMCTS